MPSNSVSGFTDFTLNGANGQQVDGSAPQDNNKGLAPTVSSDSSTLTLTTAAANQASSAFFNTPVGYQNFSVSFVYTETPDANGTIKPGNGITFTLQDDPRGANALGGGGEDLAYGTDTSHTAEPISPSFADQFTMLNGSTFSLATDGVPIASTIVKNTLPINLSSGDPIKVALSYNSATQELQERLTDTATNTGYSNSFGNINLVSILGSSTAYVGFTGGTGTSDAGQTISNFTYSATPASLPPATSVAGFGQFNLNGANGAGIDGSSRYNDNPNGVPALTADDNTLTLTTNAVNEASSAFDDAALSYNSFVANFTYVGAGDDNGGFSFTLQDDSRGQTSLGANGPNVGAGSDDVATPIAPGLSIQFNLATGNIYLNGSETFHSNIILSQGNPINFTIAANPQANIVYVTMAITNETYRVGFNRINLAQLLGSPTAYVGFTGGTTQGVVQTISNFSYSASAAPQVNLGGYAETYGIQTDGTAGVDNGYDGAGDALSYTFFGSPTGPSAQTYTAFSPAQTFFILPPNAPDVVSANGQTIAVQPGNYGNISLLGSAVNGAQPVQTIQLNYTNGTSQTITQSFSDWLAPQNFPNEKVAMTMNYRLNSTGAQENSGSPIDLYEYSIPIDPKLTLKSITLPNNQNLKIMAMNVNAPPTVSSISPTVGPPTGGTTVTINGSGFTGATAVDFGSNPATSFQVDYTGTQITAVTPAGADGTVAVTVTGPYGTSLASPADQFEYGPSWLSPDSQATWDPSTHSLLVTGPTTIVADPGSDEPRILAYSAGDNITVAPTTSPTDIHIGGLSLSNGASLTMAAVGASRSHSNHNVLVIGTPGAANDPEIFTSATSRIDLNDNDMIVHTGTSDQGNGVPDRMGVPETTELSTLRTMALHGRNVAAGGVLDGTWTGNGLTSSAAASADAAAKYEQVVLAVVQNSDQVLGKLTKWTVGSASESLGANDIIVKYTYNGDAALEGYVGDDSVSIVNAFYDGGKTTQADWAFGDFTGVGGVDDNDITILNGLYGNGTAASGLPQL